MVIKQNNINSQSHLVLYYVTRVPDLPWKPYHKINGSLLSLALYMEIICTVFYTPRMAHDDICTFTIEVRTWCLGHIKSHSEYGK